MTAEGSTTAGTAVALDQSMPTVRRNDLWALAALRTDLLTAVGT